MVSEKFRHQLRKESQQWQAEGLIDSAQYEQLSQRYELDKLDSAASDRFITILIGVGFILLGLGAITFVAANWQTWSREFRVVLLLALFLGVNISGFYLWQQPGNKPGQKRLGYGLLILGSLILGANMALMSQLFHQSGPIYELFLYWSLGVLPMAYALRLTSLGVLSQILMGISYWSALTNWWRVEEFGLSQLFIEHLPIAISLLFIPLAYYCRARIIFAIASIGITLSFMINIIPVSWWDGGGLFVAIAFTLPAALLWSYRDRLWQFSPTRSDRVTDSEEQLFSAIARSLAVCFLAIMLYVFSFHWPWDYGTAGNYLTTEQVAKLTQFFPDFLFMMIFALLGWLNIFRVPKSLNPLQKISINNGAIALVIIVTSLLFIWHLNQGEIMVVATCTINLLLAMLSIGLIRDGLTLVQRRNFWGGMVMLVLQIISRMFEYDTELLLKAVVFVVCGVAIIASGLWFERQLKISKANIYDISS